MNRRQFASTLGAAVAGIVACVAAHPSRSYTFAHLGDHLPEFLRKARRFAPAFRIFTVEGLLREG